MIERRHSALAGLPLPARPAITQRAAIGAAVLPA